MFFSSLLLSFKFLDSMLLQEPEFSWSELPELLWQQPKFNVSYVVGCSPEVWGLSTPSSGGRPLSFLHVGIEEGLDTLRNSS